jgi:hypothetical protein
LPSRFQAGRRRFLKGEIEQWFKLGDFAPSFTRCKV